MISMQSPKLLLLLSIFSFFISCLLLGQHGVQASSRHHHHHHHRFSAQKLFVFGDSYADAGNTEKSEYSPAWYNPYGITYPGRPSGRFSNGRVFSDYIAKFLGLISPVAYKLRTTGDLKYGMNFATGGTGVFQAFGPPNMTTQISQLQELIKESVYTQKDLQFSLVLVSLSGNDYAWYLSTKRDPWGLLSFITEVVNELKVNLKLIHELGAEKIVVPTLAPLGCLPRQTVNSSYENCNKLENALVIFHNILLQNIVSELNEETKSSTFVIINFYGAFHSVLFPKGTSKFPTPLKPCCVGIDSKSVCASVDDKGNKMYTVCKDPNSAFWWDDAHPTQAGWTAVYNALIGELRQKIN